MPLHCTISDAKSFINTIHKVECRLNQSNCDYHSHKTKRCFFRGNTKVGDYVTIYGKNENYRVKNWSIYCTRRKSWKFNILNSARIVPSRGSDDYIKVAGEKVYKIGREYILESLLMHISELVLKSKFKKVGMLHFY